MIWVVKNNEVIGLAHTFSNGHKHWTLRIFRWGTIVTGVNSMMEELPKFFDNVEFIFSE